MDSAGTPILWAETLVVVSDEPLNVPNVNDDLARETLMCVEFLAIPLPSLPQFLGSFLQFLLLTNTLRLFIVTTKLSPTFTRRSPSANNTASSINVPRTTMPR